MNQQVKRFLSLKFNFDGKPTKEIMQTGSETEWCVYRKIERYRDTGIIMDKPRSGRPCTAQTENMEIVRQRVKNSVHSIRKWLWENSLRVRAEML